jgi:hypothetical protein
MASFSEKVEAFPIVTFDDLEYFDPIEQLDFEVVGHKKFDLPQVSTYEPTFNFKNYRLGCEYESALR